MRLSKIIISFALIGCIVGIGPVKALAASSSEIEQQIASYMEDLDASKAKSEELKTEISEKQEEVGALYAEVGSLSLEKETYYQEMKQRIAYFYEERQGDSLMTALMSSESFADFISALQFQQAIYDYDSSRMNEYQALLDALDEKQADLDAELESLGDMVEEQAVLQATLEAAISDKEDELQEAQAAEAAAAAAAAAKAEAERRAKEDAVQYAMSSSADSSSSESSSKKTSSKKTSSNTESSSKKTSSDKGSSSSASSGSSSGGALTKSKGVVYYNGHRETWYSQKALPGTGLNIPGRHVDDNGLVCDGDGYICVASSDYSKGTVVETSLGTGKVYDSGCPSGTIDIYTNW